MKIEILLGRVKNAKKYEKATLYCVASGVKPILAQTVSPGIAFEQVVSSTDLRDDK